MKERVLMNRNFSIDKKHDKFFADNEQINASAFTRAALDKHIKDVENLREVLSMNEKPETDEVILPEEPQE